ncbi:hypothetical protein [Staphylococcus aureus]|uniref:hypothetical protein n=1 Tax=Staphylococcus aureus TaxID=1280 RepID=UPI0009835C85|nr:hypothetical protein [Staphylococcus aureus]AQR26666.1 hypothetical protein AYM28_15330 [Staphylococcus aureus]AQR53185.1 hypothetical protein AYM37_15330 [Staphylococcus aureus]
MKIIIAIFWLVILMLGGTIIVKELIKQNRIALIKAKMNNLGFSPNEIQARVTYLNKKNNRKLNEIIKNLNNKEKEEIPTINEENFFDPLFKTQNKSRLFTAIDPKGNFMAYDKHGNLLEYLNIYHLSKNDQIEIFGRILIK